MPERGTVRIMLLDRSVSANLLYQDAAIFALGPGEIGAPVETPAG
jgi:hypothetical protein